MKQPSKSIKMKHIQMIIIPASVNEVYNIAQKNKQTNRIEKHLDLLGEVCDSLDNGEYRLRSSVVIKENEEDRYFLIEYKYVKNIIKKTKWRSFMDLFRTTYRVYSDVEFHAVHSTELGYYDYAEHKVNVKNKGFNETIVLEYKKH